MKSGRYDVSGAEVKQSFTPDDGALTIIDLTLEILAQGRAPITCRPAPG